MACSNSRYTVYLRCAAYVRDTVYIRYTVYMRYTICNAACTRYAVYRGTIYKGHSINGISNENTQVEIHILYTPGRVHVLYM